MSDLPFHAKTMVFWEAGTQTPLKTTNGFGKKKTLRFNSITRQAQIPKVSQSDMHATSYGYHMLRIGNNQRYIHRLVHVISRFGLH